MVQPVTFERWEKATDEQVLREALGAEPGGVTWEGGLAFLAMRASRRTQDGAQAALRAAWLSASATAVAAVAAIIAIVATS